jgi:hypothetical protein
MRRASTNDATRSQLITSQYGRPGANSEEDYHSMTPANATPEQRNAGSRSRAPASDVTSAAAATRAAKPRQIFFDPWNSSSTGHQRAENRLSDSTSWRVSRNLKLGEQFKGGIDGGTRVADTVGAGSEHFGKDGRKENGGWEKGAKGLRTGGQKSLAEVWGASKAGKKSQEKELDHDGIKSEDVSSNEERTPEQGTCLAHAYISRPNEQQTQMRTPKATYQKARRSFSKSRYSLDSASTSMARLPLWSRTTNSSNSWPHTARHTRSH